MIYIKTGKMIISMVLAFAVFSVQPIILCLADQKPVVMTPGKAYSEWKDIKAEQHNVWTRSTPQKGAFEATSEYEERIEPFKEEQKRDSERVARKLDAFAARLYDLHIGKVRLLNGNYNADAQAWDFINIQVAGEIYPFRSEFKNSFKFTTYGLINGSTYPSASRGRTLRIEQRAGSCDILFEGHPMGRADAKALFDVLQAGNASFSILCTLTKNFTVLPIQYRLIQKGQPFFSWDTTIGDVEKDGLAAGNVR